MDIKFISEDLEIIKTIERKWSEASGFELILDKEILRWKRLSKECALGYNDVVDEYTNDLSAREFIQKILDGISENSKNELHEIIKPLDDLFIQNTIKIDQPVMAYDWVNPNKHFWYYRIPYKIKKEELSGFESQTDMKLDGKIEVF
jgi:hypothetical protein